ncbi:putative ABC transport system permease protein [Sphingomonas vulcanisoli]|uniref:ABC transport system permease protein n=1 Tax=Sphingomonas vulcanisoli TaxID=1658060 RepID=A0ABX0TTH2_9SPHN|nr:FtsX-like permease family protein [Sphingomonas vulcanisoli]NIJ07575.1 putative ABC transport system permease protein [Sphingomonas vulcanisoli]
MSNAWRLAIRDLRAGGRGLWLLLLCLFLGTAALAGIGSLSASILGALDDQSRQTLGGDLEMRVSQRRATVEEDAAFAAYGPISETVSTNTMAQPRSGGAPALVNLRAVDDAWPMVGRFLLQPGALKPRPHGLDVAIAPALADRLHLHVGDAVRIGAATLRVVGLIAEEPDKLGAGFSFGPTVITDLTGLDATQVIQPGSLYESRIHLLLPARSNAGAIGKRLIDRFPSAGWRARTPDQAADNLKRGIEQLGQFLLLVGLAALAIAGVGVGSGVSAYLDRKTHMVATLKVLGAESGMIAGLFLIQLGLVAALAIVVGLGVGAAVPAIVTAVAGDALPVRPHLALYPEPLLVAAGLSLLVALLFALPALARARSVPAATLLRDAVLPMRRPSVAVLAGMAAVLGLLVALTVLTASDRRIALGFVGATFALVVALWFLGLGLRWLIARLPHPRRPLLRLALANLHRPGAQTDRLVVALGLGFSLFVALAVIDTSLAAELTNAAPAKAPRFFAIDLQPEDATAFQAAIRSVASRAKIEAVPSLRGSIVALKGQRVADMKTLPEGAWILKGDRTITWSATLPPRNTLVAGHWWPPNYDGPPLVSMEDRAAQMLGLRVGDTITVAVLGVDVPARISALRKVDWGGLGLNFALVFSPGYIQEAPHGLLATVYAPSDRDGAIAGAVASVLPSVTLIRTGDIIGQLGDMLQRIALAIRAAAAVTVLAGIVVLIGAVTASGQARRYDVVILKLLGGSRSQLLAGQALEYLLLSVLLAAVASAVGGGAGWYVVTRVLNLPWSPDIGTVGLTLAAAVGATLTIGVTANIPILRASPAQGLRAA